ncbi:hypothetical protein NLI94_15135, partial [Acidithiobacillus ferrivorans]
SALLEPADDVFHRRLPPRLDLRNHTLVESAARLAEERNRSLMGGQRLLADIQQRKANDIIRPIAARKNHNRER